MVLLPAVQIEGKIYLVRGQKIMLSTDLARLYGVEPKVLVQAVKRNIERFPENFLFPLSKDEHANVKSQQVTSSAVYRAAGKRGISNRNIWPSKVRCH